MRTYIFLSILIVCLQAENITICDVCDCQQRGELPGFYVDVDCSFRGRILEMNTVLPNNTTSLNLSRSKLTRIPPNGVLKSTTILELLLNKNSLKDINLESFELPELRRLDLSENELETLNPNLFKHITKLEYLNLADNKFTAASQLNFNLLVNLTEIILDNNNIGADVENRSLFDVNGYGLPITIQSISMSGVHLKNLSSEYFNPVVKTLRKLVVSNNNFTKIPKLPTHLVYLDISNNPITNITSDDFPWLEPLYLNVLKLNNLEIQEIPKGTFRNLMLFHLELENNRNLKVFSNLSFGGIVLFDQYGFFMDNFTLNGSNLTTLDKSLYYCFNTIKRLDLQNNPWVCDCRLAWIRRLRIATDLKHDLRCAWPPYLYNKRIFDLTEEDFVCLKSDEGYTEVGMTIGLVLYALLMLVTVSWIYVFIYQPGPRVNKREYSQLQ